MRALYRGIIHLGTFLSPFLLLAIRLFWGYLLVLSGLGKLYDPTPVIDFFASLGIPVPTLSVYLTALVELIGGALFIVGFGARLAAIPLIIVFITAFMTAHYDAVLHFVENPEGIASQSPFNYLLASLIIFCFGPGLFSIDAIFKRVYRKRNPPVESAP